MRKRELLHLLEGTGIEIEYMVVRKDTLDVLPVSDKVIRAAAGSYVNEYENGNMGWSNEFVLHIMEIKNMHPAPSLKGLGRAFHDEVKRINKILVPFNGTLMPSGMHPWMDPCGETRLWPHQYRKIYETYDRIFNCRRHGWANLQSIHVNISFNGDKEFGRLHAAIRLLLPIIPALAASSPVAGGKITGLRDTRLFHYVNNQRKVPSVAGKIIPEPMFTIAGYRENIFGRMYNDMAKHDPAGTLRHEWLNSRGAIPRFERNAFEIRLIDTQECPAANIAVSEMVLSVITRLVSEHWSPLKGQQAWKVSPLVSIFKEAVKKGEKAVIDNSRYLAMFGFPEPKATAGELWRYLAEESFSSKTVSPASMKIIRFILDQGTLSTRILGALGKDPSHDRLRDVYGKLCKCLASNKLFTE